MSVFDGMDRNEILNLVIAYADEPEILLDHPMPTIGVSQFMARVATAIEEWMLFGFQAGWMSSGEGYNGEYPDEGVPWDVSAGREAYARWRDHASASTTPEES